MAWCHGKKGTKETKLRPCTVVKIKTVIPEVEGKGGKGKGKEKALSEEKL